MKLNRQQIQTLVRLVAETRLEEIDCDEMLAVLSRYADKVARGETTGGDDDESVSIHLEICPECREEFEMIQAIANEGKLKESE